MTHPFKAEIIENLKKEAICNEIVKAQYERSICPEGAGGDEGIDCYEREINGKGDLHLFQSKYLLKSLGHSVPPNLGTHNCI